MKYCYKCGNQMEDDMLFCQKCGARASNDTASTSNGSDKVTQEDELKQAQVNQEKTASVKNNAKANNLPSMRKSMKIWMIICFVFAGLFVLIGAVVGETGMAVGVGGFFAVLGGMFLVLAKSPKGNPYILNRQSGLKKKIFVLICVVIGFVVAGIGLSITSTTLQNGEEQFASQQDVVTKQNDETPKDNKSNKNITLRDVKHWYEEQIPVVSQSLVDYAKSVDGLTAVNVDSNELRFGDYGGWYECHYTLIFTCKVNGSIHRGEARAFLKYQDDTMEWYHFEIFSNTGLESLVDYYDDSYVLISEDYYKELESLYK